MAHLVIVRDGWIELRYTGVVDYAARMSALDAVTTAVLESGVHRILGDYTRATLGDAGFDASAHQARRARMRCWREVC